MCICCKLINAILNDILAKHFCSNKWCKNTRAKVLGYMDKQFLTYPIQIDFMIFIGLKNHKIKLKI